MFGGGGVGGGVGWLVGLDRERGASAVAGGAGRVHVVAYWCFFLVGGCFVHCGGFFFV